MYNILKGRIGWGFEPPGLVEGAMAVGLELDHL